jgi:hypothetical protein
MTVDPIREVFERQHDASRSVGFYVKDPDGVNVQLI